MKSMVGGAEVLMHSIFTSCSSDSVVEDLLKSKRKKG